MSEAATRERAASRTRDFDGRVALVTGGGSGIGRAVALGFSRAGARVIVADIDTVGGEQTARQATEAGGVATYLRVDVTDAASTAALVDATLERHGALHCAVNCAGVLGRQSRIADCPDEEWHRVIDVNLTGAWHSMKHELRAMLAVRPTGGSIVNIASAAGLGGFPTFAPYSASKHGVIGLTKSAAVEYAKKQIRVNAVCPAYTQTPMMEESVRRNPDLAALALKSVPLGRLGTAEEVAEAALYLSSPSAGFITGQTLVLDGGLLAW